MDAWQTFRRLTKLGFPQHFQIVQFPNLPLIIAFIAGRSSHYFHSTTHHYLLSVAYIAMAIWAYEELASGSNWFRRLLGMFFITVVVVHVANALHM